MKRKGPQRNAYVSGMSFVSCRVATNYNYTLGVI
jgi:hypothetical protein